MTPQQAYAIANSIWRYLNRVHGYQMFGYDWRTLAITYPQICAKLRECYGVLEIPV